MLYIRLKQRTASLFKLAELAVATRRMVHDISTPLNVILLNIHQVNIHDLKKTSSAVIRAQYCAESMTKFVGSVKEKIENQENRTWFPLKETLETAKKICETDRIHIRIIGYENSILYGNESKLLQAVVNIVQNSVDSYDDRKGRIQIKAVLQNNHLELMVSDRGKGMDREMIENLGNFTTKTDTLLNGVGYEAAKEITQRDFNGDIRTKSTKGRGTKTTMQIKVPIRLDSDLPRQPQRLP
jgi:C4-dicarboxylate-specific signal transduction histidine kinase